MKAPLEGHPVFRVSSYDSLENAVKTALSARLVELPAQPATLDAHANRFPLSNSSLWFCSYGTPVAIRFPEPDHIRVQFHHAGIGATWIGDDLIPVTGQQACITTTAAEFDFGDAFQQFVWRIPRDVVRQKLAGLTDAPLRGDLAFEPKLNLSHPRSQVLLHLLGCVVQTSEFLNGDTAKIVLGELEQALLSALLTASTHRYRDHLEQKAPAAAPWQVRRAESYIAANWDKPLTLETLAEVTGASVRSIFRTFKQSRGYTPLEFAKKIRLSHARRMLDDSEGTGSVTHIAFACGFGDLGRFSRDFAQAFGEKPSDVLKRRKGMLKAA